jgi:hypothetical protein
MRLDGRNASNVSIHLFPLVRLSLNDQFSLMQLGGIGVDKDTHREREPLFLSRLIDDSN